MRADRRRPEQELWAAFEKERPRILSVLLDAVVQGLKMLPQTRLEKLPRMADFALWATACETAFWAAGTFATAFDANRKELIEGVLDADAIASAIRGLMAIREEWVGTASQLLAALEEVAGERVTKSKNWPTTAEALGRGLRRPATFLRKVGIEISFERDTSARRTRQVKITRKEVEPDNRAQKPSEPSEPSGWENANKIDSPSLLSELPSDENTNEINASDGSDSSDSKTQSNGGRTCAQCNAGGEPLAQVEGVAPPVYLHPECRRFWLKDHPEADGLAACLRRAPALGSAGESPDDFK